MPDKRRFDEMSETKEERPSKKRKLTKENSNDDLLDILKAKAQVLNHTYLKLLDYTHSSKKYSQYENMYRNEEMDIVSLLKKEMCFPEFMNKEHIGLNHVFRILPLDKVNKKDLEDIVEDIGDEDSIDEDSDLESSTGYDPIEDAKNMLEKFFKMDDVEDPNTCDKLIEKSNLQKTEKDKLMAEYEKIKELRKSHLPDKLKVLQMEIPLIVKSEILEKMELLDSSPQDDVKARDWIRQIMKIPFGNYSPSPIENKKDNKQVKKFLEDLHKTLDDAIYGQNNVKETLIEIITKWATSGSTKGNCIAINGPPGVGKTSIVREGLAKALNRPFCSFSLAGVSDENYLTGFPFTYEGATCGRFARMLMDTGCMNPIIFMDELDKVDTKRSMSVYNKLIELTDFSQNHEIEDHYFGSHIKLDLSQCIFVFSLNDINNVDPILRDRLEVINVKGFERNEKIKIAKEFLIPRQMKDFGVDYKFSEDIIKHIIMRVKNEEGVRNLQRGISKILRKLNVLQYYNNKKLSYKMKDFNKKKLKITTALIDILLKDEEKPNQILLKMYS